MTKKNWVRSAAALALVALLSTTFANAADAASKPKLLLNWEFSGKAGTKVSSKIFNYDMFPGGNGERVWYTQNDKNTLSLDGKGHLVFKATKLDDVNDPNYLMRDTGALFKSARVQTQYKMSFKYGRLSARIKTSAGAGTWPAFWLLGANIDSESWPACGEIDILETKGSNPNGAYGTVHGPGYSGGQGIGGVFTSASDLSAGYHTYTLDWKKDWLQFSVDGIPYKTITPRDALPNKWVYNQRFFLILNLAMGGIFTGDVDPNLTNATFSIDWIKYWQVNGQGTLYKK
jgi:beta-glucanase (GH16 family)